MSLPVIIGDNALEALVAFCHERHLERFALVADRNTDAALGQRVETLLRAEGWDVLKIIVEGEAVGADKDAVYQVMLGLDGLPRTFLAVGSGTITDITRFVSHRSGRPFISMPTAASVDGFTSIGAPMIIDGVKITLNCQGSIAIFAHLPTLTAAPRALTAAGVADLLAKLTSIADWELGGLLWGEPFDPAIAARSRRAARSAIDAIDAIAAREPDGLRVLMAGLVESGLCMLDFGETRPASGYEHHMSHFWEMKLLKEGRPAVLHGAKVGLGLMISAALYERVRGISRDEAAALLDRSTLPERAAEIQRIRAAYGPMAEQLLAIQAPFLDLTPQAHEALKSAALAHWGEIRAIADTVPSPALIRTWLSKTGGPVEGAALGLTAAEIELAADASHFYRCRFTVKKLARLLRI